MHYRSPPPIFTSCLIALCLAMIASLAEAHGGVFLAEDQCLIQIGVFSAHFKAYQPRTRQDEQFCEDLPAAAETVFVMEYSHGPLGKVPIDFRIIKDVTGLDKLAKLEDVKRIGNLEGATVFYQAPAVHPHVFTAIHRFTEPGWYVGIVTARHPTLDKTYTAVFPFKVGFAGFGYGPLFAALAICIQLVFWLANGQFSRWRARWRGIQRRRVLRWTLMTLLLLLPGIASAQAPAAGGDHSPAAASAAYTSKSGRYRIGYRSKLDPIEINRMHDWVLHIETTEGVPLANGKITFNGGMPAHNHGLPTRAQVTQYLGDGDYLVEGMRFHMAGHWEIEITISAGGASDTCIIPLDL